MDVDYANDKGSYATVPVTEEIVLVSVKSKAGNNRLLQNREFDAGL